MWSYRYDPYLEHKLNFKYIDKYKSKLGNWVYVYKEKAKKAISKIPNTIITRANTAVNKTKKIYNDATMDNIYSIKKSTRTEKIAKVSETPEWKKIIESKNEEYKNIDGTYNIDDYILKKKHPVYDALTDIASGRDISINDITISSMLAGVSDYVDAAIAYVALRVEILAVGVKYRQGSYDQYAQSGERLVNTLLNEYSKSDLVTYSRELATVSQAVDNAVSEYKNLSSDQITKTFMNNETVSKVMQDNGLTESDLQKAVSYAQDKTIDKSVKQIKSTMKDKIKEQKQKKEGDE